MVPGRFQFVDILPRTPSGKIDRRALQSRTAPERAVPSEPADSLELELLALWRQFPGFESAGVTDNFFELGGHSLLAARLIKDVRAHINSQLPIAAIVQAPTVRDLAKLLRAGPNRRPWSPLVPIRTTGSRPPFFCVHGIGGTVLPFERLAFHLPADQPFYGIQAAGLESGAVHQTIEDMAAAYLKAVRGVQPFGPYLLGGYSAGGMIAFEMAHRLRAAGESVALLALFDANRYGALPAGFTALPEPRPSPARRALSRLHRLRRLSRSEQWQTLRRGWDYYRWLSGMTLRVRWHRILRQPLPTPAAALFAAVERYKCLPYDGAVVLFRAILRDGTNPPCRDLGWSPLLCDLSVENAAAHHDVMLYEPNAKPLAQTLNLHIRLALARTATTAPASIEHTSPIS
jgi:thioesterase domain-containing protein